MAAPDSSFVVVDPPPLNSDVFPYAVQPIPGFEFRDFAGLLRTVALDAEVVLPENPLRFE